MSMREAEVRLFGVAEVAADRPKQMTRERAERLLFREPDLTDLEERRQLSARVLGYLRETE